MHLLHICGLGVEDVDFINFDDGNEQDVEDVNFVLLSIVNSYC